MQSVENDPEMEPQNGIVIENEDEYNKCTQLKEQINWLQEMVQKLQDEVECRDEALANTLRGKEHARNELKRLKHANLNLRQQLEDERDIYLKEKEHYCKELTEMKKSKSKKNRTEQLWSEEQVNQLRTELTKFKSLLNETLETNYNLSIKFLRMKNTKYSLQARYKRAETERVRSIVDLTTKLENVEEEMSNIISDKFLLPIPPSNKKYLHLVKRNMQLVHENLHLQVQLSKLCTDLERLKAERVRNETNCKLQYLRKPGKYQSSFVESSSGAGRNVTITRTQSAPVILTNIKNS